MNNRELNTEKKKKKQTPSYFVTFLTFFLFDG